MMKKRLKIILIVFFAVGLAIAGASLWQPALPRALANGEVLTQLPTTLAGLAEAIRNGDIDVGTEHGLAFDQRYHKIHAEVLGLECATCHTKANDMPTSQAIFSAQDVSPQAPGPVDRRACLGCHRTGPGKDLYASNSHP